MSLLGAHPTEMCFHNGKLNPLGRAEEPTTQKKALGQLLPPHPWQHLLRLLVFLYDKDDAERDSQNF